MDRLVSPSLALLGSAMLLSCQARPAGDPQPAGSANNATATVRDADPRPTNAADATTEAKPTMIAPPLPSREARVSTKPPAPARSTPAAPSAPAPGRDIEPSPFQIPADVDPPHVDPGDEVPR